MLSIFSKCLTLHTSLYKSQNIRHGPLDAQKHSLFQRYSFFKTKNSTLFSDIPGNILFLKKKHYYSSIYAAIYGAGQVQDPRHPHPTSYTNYSFSFSEQKEKEEE